MIDRDRLVESFLDLVRIDSPSGEEEAMAAALTGRLEALGLDVVRDSYGNLIASDGRPGPIMLSAHMDTVEPGRGVSPGVDGDRITADGTTVLGGDSKAGVAAILEALESLQEDGAQHIPIEIVLSREEELALRGARNLDYSMINSQEAVVFDAEGPVSQIISSSPTYVGFDIEVTGRAAHAGVEPEKGLSAIKLVAELISRLPQGRLDAETTFNVGTVKGGNVRNTVPESASLVGEFRSTDLETLDGLRLQITEALDAVRRRFPDATIEDHIHTDFEAYTLSDDDPATRRVKGVIRSVGLRPTMKHSGGGSDANIFRLKGISAVVVGIADHHMHTLQEYVTIPDLLDVARFSEALIRA